MTEEKSKFVYSVFWNCALILVGCLIQAIAYKGLAIPKHLVPGGVFGVSSLIYYLTDWLNPGLLNIILNIPMFILGYVFLSKRFLAYSAMAMLATSLIYQVVDFTIPIDNQLYAVLVYGVIFGAGGGIVLRSLGSSGGLDVIAIILFQKYNIGLGKTYFTFNFTLFCFSFATLDADLVIASMIGMFVASRTIDYVQSMFNQRKLTFIVSEEPESIAEKVMAHLKIGTTMLPAVGAYHRQARTVLMVVINDVQLKRLEEIVFTTDRHALFIVENTFNVLGSSFSQRKIY